MENGKIIGILIGGIGLGAALGAGVTLQLKNKASKSASSAGGAQATCSIDGVQSNEGALFELDGQSFGREELPGDARDVLFQIQNQTYESTVNFTKELALRIALAKDGGKYDPAKLPPLKELLKADTISEEDMKKFFEANKQSIPPGTKYEQIKPQLEQFLVAQRVGETARQRIAELESKGRLKLLAKAPTSPVVNLKVDQYPNRGAPDAKVTLVEVSDYLCPHCRTVKPEVEQALKEFEGKVKFVQINFALNPNGLSGALTRGGFCAQKQSSEAFWKYHDKAFAVSLEAANAVSPDAAKEFNATAVTTAKDAGIDVVAFEKCLSSDEAKAAIAKTTAEMNAAGVSGTPSFFINNRKVSLAGGSLAQKLRAELEGSKAN